MGIKPPQHLHRVDYIDVVRVERDIKGEPVIHYRDREVIKEVERLVFKDDPKLLEQLNKSLKENGELKQALANKPQMKTEYIQAEPRIVEVEKFIHNIMREVYIGAGSLILGIVLCWLMVKLSYPHLLQ